MTDRRGTAISTLMVSIALIAGCTDGTDSSEPAGPSTASPMPTASASIDDPGEALPEDPPGDFAEVQSERNVAIPDSTPFSVDCDDDTLGADDEYAFPTAYLVVDGALGELCRGEPDERLLDAWDTLATIAPADQLSDLGVFSAFEVTEDEPEITLAFVSPLDADGTQFQMAIELESSVDDPAEALLTIAHEFSHVFTSMPTQIDRTVEGANNCVTYDNGEGCFFADSLIFQWIEQFWGDGLIDDFDPQAEPSASDGEERCRDDPGFFGPYAASDPEEDFAESFSAYVFDVEADTAEQQERLDWLAAQPGLAEFRERAVDAGLTPVRNGFEVCG